MWHQWADQQTFDVWHTAACAALGIPHAGFNAATGDLDEAAQWTTAYTDPVTTDAGVLAAVDPDVAAQVPEGLGVPCDPPPAPDLPY
jgi:hypothetical protein